LKQRRLIHERSGSHLLFVEPDGSLVLEVSVGTIALYAVALVLDASEVARYRDEGAAFIDALALDIVKDEPRFRAAGRTKVL
jgi:hypothetical protein